MDVILMSNMIMIRITYVLLLLPQIRRLKDDEVLRCQIPERKPGDSREKEVGAEGEEKGMGGMGFKTVLMQYAKY